MAASVSVVRRGVGAAMVIVQLALVAIAFLLSLPRRALDLICRLDVMWGRAIYYRWVKLRRRVVGEPSWKEIDLRINEYPPSGHPWWKEAGIHEVNGRPCGPFVDDGNDVP